MLLAKIAHVWQGVPRFSQRQKQEYAFLQHFIFTKYYLKTPGKNYTHVTAITFQVLEYHVTECHRRKLRPN